MSQQRKRYTPRKKSPCLYREDLTGASSPLLGYKVVVDPKLGANTRMQPEQPIRRVEGKFQSGRVWQAVVYPSDTWAVFKASAARKMDLTEEQLVVVVDGEEMQVQDLVPQNCDWIDFKWRRGRSPRSRSHHPPQRRSPEPEEEDQLYFYYETKHGAWRLPVMRRAVRMNG